MADGGESTSAAGLAAGSSPSPAQLRLNRLGSYLLTLLIGAAGALTFLYVHMPLPWFLGSLLFCLLASVANAPVSRPVALAIAMRAVLGVAIGSAFSPALLSRLGGMLGSIAILVPFMALIIIVSLVFYEKVAGFDRATAFFSAVPGGLADMTAMAEDAGAKPRAVILVQATRILIVVFTLPLWVQWHNGVAIGSVVASRVHLSEVSALDLLILFGIGFCGWFVARRLKLAGAPIVGPMIFSGLLHATGLTTLKMPMEILTFAQISVGAMLGCQFRGLTRREFTGTMVWGLGNTIVLLTITAVVVTFVARITGFDPVSVLLGFAPGGQTELNLLAFILGLDVAYVALHHLVRLAVVILGAQIVFKSRTDWRKSTG